MIKRIVLCADDYGQAPAISKSILALLQKKRLSAVSCMVNSPFWREHATWLAPFRGQIDIGLHFNLTEGYALSQDLQRASGVLTALPKLFLNAFLHRLNQDLILAEYKAQLEEFVRLMGFMPDFIDGHQHVHQFPQVRDALLKTDLSRFRANKAYMRLAREPVHSANMLYEFKKIIISYTAKKMAKLLDQNRVPYNATFAGIYPFSKKIDYGVFFENSIARLGDRGLMMCHPSFRALNQDIDTIKEARYAEYLFLDSDKFTTVCAQKKVEIGRFGT